MSPHDRDTAEALVFASGAGLLLMGRSGVVVVNIVIAAFLAMAVIFAGLAGRLA